MLGGPPDRAPAPWSLTTTSMRRRRNRPLGQPPGANPVRSSTEVLTWLVTDPGESFVLEPRPTDCADDLPAAGRPGRDVPAWLCRPATRVPPADAHQRQPRIRQRLPTAAHPRMTPCHPFNRSTERLGGSPTQPVLPRALAHHHRLGGAEPTDCHRLRSSPGDGVRHGSPRMWSAHSSSRNKSPRPSSSSSTHADIVPEISCPTDRLSRCRTHAEHGSVATVSELSELLTAYR